MKIDISLPQVYAGLRYAGVGVGAVMSFLTVMNAVSPDTAHQIVTAFQLVIDDLQKTIGDTSKLLVLVVPLVTTWLAYIGVHSASAKKQVEAVNAQAPQALIAAVQTVAPKALIAATQALPAAQVTVTDPKLAEGVPGVVVK